MWAECSYCRAVGQKADHTTQTALYFTAGNIRRRCCNAHAAEHAQGDKKPIAGTQWVGELWAEESGKAHLNKQLRVKTPPTPREQQAPVISRPPSWAVARVKLYSLVHQQGSPFEKDLHVGDQVLTLIKTWRKIAYIVPPQAEGDCGKVVFYPAFSEPLVAEPAYIKAQFVRKDQ